MASKDYVVAVELIYPMYECIAVEAENPEEAITKAIAEAQKVPLGYFAFNSKNDVPKYARFSHFTDEDGEAIDYPEE